MKKKNSPLIGRTCALGMVIAAVLLALFAGIYAIQVIRSLRAGLEAVQTQLYQSEQAHISDLYGLQKELGSLRQEGTSDGFPSEKNLSEALHAGEIESVLILGDSISDGCGDGSRYIYGHAKREEQGCRQIMADEEAAYYESAPDGQGWVSYFREYLLENTAVTVFHNNSIGGKSAKWFNAHREEAVTQDYDLIVVMLGTNDRWDCVSTEEFYVEYASLLSWVKERCSYLQVLTPTPTFAGAYPTHSNGPALCMDACQAADIVLTLCADKGYDCLNLYSGLLNYSIVSGHPLDDFYSDGTHLSVWGYQQIWRIIAGKLEINTDIGRWYDMDSTEGIAPVFVGYDREDLTESTNLYEVSQDMDVFPVGISIYKPGPDPFADVTRYGGGTVVTYRYESGGGRQILKPQYSNNDFIRYAGEDGVWGAWYPTNIKKFAPLTD